MLAGPHKPAPGFARRSPTCSNGRICSRWAYDRRRAAGAAASRYLAQTEAMLEDPTGTLPHYPMVLHRGGWPDGS